MINIAVLGLGSRGNGYMTIAKLFCKNRAKVVALCDILPDRLAQCAKKFKVDADKCFTSDEEFFAAGKLADAIFICTQDRDHYAHAVKAIELGYHILCEKPLSPSVEECADLVRRVEEKGVRMLVCHVLRYSEYYNKIKQIIDSGVIGEVVGINHTENIGYYHYAHSYVRGNWRDSNTTSPMIMAKTCHDMDLIHWYMGGGCETISSFGFLKHFKEENAPEGSTARCLDGCKAKERCPFDAERLYLTDPLYRATFLRFRGRTLTNKDNPTKEDKYEALRTGGYGRCVYRSDNNVCDHQVVNMRFSGDRVATLTVSAFTKGCFRNTHIMGPRGEIICKDSRNKLTLKIFRDGVKKVRAKIIPFPFHLGGDVGIVKDFVNMLEGKPTILKDLTTVDVTYFSHKMAMAAEYSRLHNGESVDFKSFKG
jgi:predicted dehydrogenase